jgi:hypothetical protein
MVTVYHRLQRSVILNFTPGVYLWISYDSQSKQKFFFPERN